MKLRATTKPKVAVTTKMKTIYTIGIVLALSGIIGACVFVYLNLSNSENVFAAGSTYSSTKSGTWTTNSTWAGGTAPPTTSINGDDITVNSSHSVSSGALDVLNNAIFTVNSSGKLTITGDLTVQNNLVLNVSGLLIITGNLSTKNGGNITINGGGIVKVSGSASFNNNTVLTVNGGLQVGSTLSFGSNATFKGSGVVKLGSGSGCSVWTGTGTCGFGALPVKLLSFIAEETNGNVKITWKTAAEENNDFFTIQRTADGKNYTTIARIKGAGNSKTALSYEYDDQSPLEGRSYYRLSQTDFDGKSETFPHVTVDVSKGSSEPKSSFTLYPNPLTGNVLNVSISKPEAGVLEVIDSKGNRILSQNVDAIEKEVQLSLNENMEPGIYLVSYKTSSTTKTERLIKR